MALPFEARSPSWQRWAATPMRPSGSETHWLQPPHSPGPKTSGRISAFAAASGPSAPGDGRTVQPITDSLP